MRKLCFTLAFVLATTFSFAGSNSLLTRIGGGGITCVTVTTSCGIVGTVCGYTTQEILEGAAELDEWMCGGGDQ